jgi:hypothetical protein
MRRDEERGLLENPENPQGFLGTGCDTDMVLYSTRILKDKVCATKGLPTPGQVTWPQNR